MVSFSASITWYTRTLDSNIHSDLKVFRSGYRESPSHSLTTCSFTVSKVPASKPHWRTLLMFAILHFHVLALTHRHRHNLDMYFGEVNWAMPLNKSPIKVQSCAWRRFYLWRHRERCVYEYVLCKKSISQGVSEMNLTSVSLTCCLQRCHFRAFLTSPQTLSDSWKWEQG